MIKFFRRIRQKLLSENKFSKYVLYAIGEIVLVVIGILIALQINNWNERRNLREMEVNLLLEMKENLLNDLADIEFNIDEDMETLRSNEIILNRMENRLPFVDSLKGHYGKLQRNSTLVENTSAYENLKTFGVNLISNDSLRRRITNLYSARYPYIDEVNLRISNQIIWNHLNPILVKNMRSKIVLEEAFPIDHDQLMDNTAFMEAIRWHISIKKFTINLYTSTKIEIQKIIQLIDKELTQ